MDPVTDTSPEGDVTVSPALMVKEYFFMLIVIIMGFSGLSLCVHKLYPESDDDIENIIVHDIEYAQAGLLSRE